MSSIDIILQNFGWVIALITFLISFGSLIWKIRGWIDKIDYRLRSIEENPFLLATKSLTIQFWSELLHSVFEKEIIKKNPLTSEEIKRRIELTKKLEQKIITPDEAKELHEILNKELEEAKATNNFLAILAILFLLGWLITLSKK